MMLDKGPGPHRHHLPGCMDTDSWPGPEELELELELGLEVFPLLGKLPIIPQQTLRRTLNLKRELLCRQSPGSQLGPRYLTVTGG